jgi:glycosyltransferase involved in cell wall biosynthesis
LRTFVLDARTATDDFPGIGRYVSNLAQSIVPLLASDENLLLLYDPGISSRWTLPETPFPAVQIVPTSTSVFSIAQQWQIPRLLRKHRASVYHSPYYLMPYRPGVPTLVMIHDLIPQLFPEYASMRARLFFRLATRLALKAAELVSTNSQATRDTLLAHYPVPPANVISILPAPDPAMRPASPSVVADLRERLQLPDEYVLYVGSNRPHKNLARLLEAWRLIVADREATPILVLAGPRDRCFPQVRRQAQDLGLSNAVCFLGPIAEPDLAALYSGAKLFVFPSLYEGFGFPAIEAMACGTPVACSNTSSLPEVVGEAAALFDPTSVEEISDVLRSLLQDAALRQDLARRGLDRASQFTWRRTASATLECYRRMG